MLLPFTPTFTDFRAGESAPLPEQIEALNPFLDRDGLLILNELGSMALRALGLGEKVVLDDTVSPPVIRFKDAELQAVHGFVLPKNRFTHFKDPQNFRTMIIRGEYAGPSSVLRIAAIPNNAVVKLLDAA